MGKNMSNASMKFDLGEDVVAVFVEKPAEIEPTPTKNHDLGEVCLPKLVDCRCLSHRSLLNGY